MTTDRITSDTPLSDAVIQRKTINGPLVYVRLDDCRKIERALQARIDALMLEHCPEEMTATQRQNWARHQKPVSPEREAEIDRIINQQ